MSESNENLELSVNVHEAKNRCRVDFNFFAGLCLPHVMRFAYPRYYIVLWQLLVAAIEEHNVQGVRKLLRYVIGLPRGFTKTTYLKVLVCWLIVHDKLQFILIICATEPLAETFLSDVQDILQSENIENLFGAWQPAVDNSDTKKGAYHHTIVIIKARGSGSAVRGINESNMRPQLILCDDMQTKENDESDTDRERLFTWFVGTLLKTVDQFVSIVIYVGNMYSDHCILYKLKHHPMWTSLITGAILENGESLWPELWSIESLYQDFLHDEAAGKADIWFAEVMNDPIESINSLLTAPLPIQTFNYIPHPDASFVTLDLAGFRANSDDNVATAHYLSDNKGYVAEMIGGIWTPQTTCKNTLELAVRHESALIGIEEVGYQQAMIFWMTEYMQQEKINGISVVPLKRGSRLSKEQHIRIFIKELYDQNYAFIRPSDRAKFTWQATAYKTGKNTNKDDWMDSAAMGITIRTNYAHMLTVRKRLEGKSEECVYDHNTPF